MGERWQEAVCHGWDEGHVARWDRAAFGINQPRAGVSAVGGCRGLTVSKIRTVPTETITQRVGGTEAGEDSWGNQTCRESRNINIMRALSKEDTVGKVLYCTIHIGYVTKHYENRVFVGFYPWTCH